MNVYSLMANSYRNLANLGKIDKETANKEIRIFDFLSTCDNDDICQLVDSSAFNDIIRAFTRRAVQNADIDKESQKKVLTQLEWLFDTNTAKEILEK